MKILTTRNYKIITASIIALCICCIPLDLQAGTGGSEFNQIWATLKQWIQGALGRIIVVSMILVGIVAGIARQSLMAFALGLGGGMGLYNAPIVVETMFSATFPESVQDNTIVQVYFENN